MSSSGKYIAPALAAVITAVAFALMRKKWTSRDLAYPPGPKGYPIIGNLFDFPEVPIWEGLMRMAQEYKTGILHLNMMGSHLVLLSDSDVSAELVERSSANYADRPRLPMINELMGGTWFFSLMPYGDTWRIHRKLFHRFFNVTVVDQFDDKIYKAVDVFLHRLSESPDRFFKHVHFMTGSLSLTITYGLNVESENDKVYAAAEEATKAVGVALVPGAFLVDTFPILKYVPEWFPGAGFKRFARLTKQSVDNSVKLPFQLVKESFQANAITTSSFVATCLEELPELSQDGVDEEVICGVGGQIYLGAEDTSSSTIKSFLLAATLHPEVVRLAQEELDRVIGGDRLPDLSDKPQLPYISAIMKEVLRWKPPVPLAGGHRVTEDDVFRGQLIPAGALAIDNVWAMFHDESVYANADTFDPGRFIKDGQINPDVRDPELQVFGHGRRVCPGRHFVLRVLFVTVARFLATFNISKPLDEDGNPIVPDGKYIHGGIIHPLPFRSDIKPRSAHALCEDECRICNKEEPEITHIQVQQHYELITVNIAVDV